MTDLLRIKYSPLLISELENNHDDIISLIKGRLNFCIYGKIGIGKTTIMKTILENMNIDYIYVDTYNKSLDEIIKSVNKKTVMSYFKNCHSVILFDNFDSSLYMDIPQHCIFILNKPLRKIPSILIKEPGVEYLEYLVQTIVFLEKSLEVVVYNFINYHMFFSELECSISTNKNIKCEYLFKSNKQIYKQLYLNLPLSKKIFIANQVDDYNNFQMTYISGISSIEEVAKSLESISLSTTMDKTEYYPILGLVIPSMSIDKQVIEKQTNNYNISKKYIKKNYSLNEILWSSFKNKIKY
jgi:hypothetical protein